MGFNDVLVLVVCFGIGGSLVLVAVYVASRAHASESWPTVPGEVTWSRVRIRGRTRRTILWAPEVEYDYWIDGGRYSGNRLRFTVWRLDGEGQEAANKRIAPYPKRAAISVRYNPDDPGDSVLETRPDWNAVAVCAVLGLMFIAFGCYLALVILGIFPAWD